MQIPKCSHDHDNEAYKPNSSSKYAKRGQPTQQSVYEPKDPDLGTRKSSTKPINPTTNNATCTILQTKRLDDDDPSEIQLSRNLAEMKRMRYPPDLKRLSKQPETKCLCKPPNKEREPSPSEPLKRSDDYNDDASPYNRTQSRSVERNKKSNDYNDDVSPYYGTKSRSAERNKRSDDYNDDVSPYYRTKSRSAERNKRSDNYNDDVSPHYRSKRRSVERSNVPLDERPEKDFNPFVPKDRQQTSPSRAYDAETAVTPKQVRNGKAPKPEVTYETQSLTDTETDMEGLSTVTPLTPMKKTNLIEDLKRELLLSLGEKPANQRSQINYQYKLREISQMDSQCVCVNYRPDNGAKSSKERKRSERKQNGLGEQTDTEFQPESKQSKDRRNPLVTKNAYEAETMANPEQARTYNATQHRPSKNQQQSAKYAGSPPTPTKKSSCMEELKSEIRSSLAEKSNYQPDRSTYQYGGRGKSQIVSKCVCANYQTRLQEEHIQRAKQKQRQNTYANNDLPSRTAPDAVLLDADNDPNCPPNIYEATLERCDDADSASSQESICSCDCGCKHQKDSIIGVESYTEATAATLDQESLSNVSSESLVANEFEESYADFFPLESPDESANYDESQNCSDTNCFANKNQDNYEKTKTKQNGATTKDCCVQVSVPGNESSMQATQQKCKCRSNKQDRSETSEKSKQKPIEKDSSNSASDESTAAKYQTYICECKFSQEPDLSKNYELIEMNEILDDGENSSAPVAKKVKLSAQNQSKRNSKDQDQDQDYDSSSSSQSTVLSVNCVCYAVENDEINEIFNDADSAAAVAKEIKCTYQSQANKNPNDNDDNNDTNDNSGYSSSFQSMVLPVNCVCYAVEDEEEGEDEGDVDDDDDDDDEVEEDDEEMNDSSPPAGTNDNKCPCQKRSEQKAKDKQKSGKK